MDLKQIRALVDLVSRNQLSELELEQEDFRIRIAKYTGGPASTSMQSAASYLQAAAPPAAEFPAASAPPAGTLIVSPMVGTFYCSPSPESPPFVSVGTQVGCETTVCIIEAMKVMNEIKAEVSGTILEILAENGKPVEFGQPLFRVKA